MNQTILRNDLRHLCWVAQSRQKKFILSSISPSSAFKRASMAAGENANRGRREEFLTDEREKDEETGVLYVSYRTAQPV